MRKVLLVCAAVLTYVGVKAQQDVQVSQNDFNTMYINPGYAGMNDAICATFQGRLQNMGFNGGPQTGIFSAHAPVRVLRGGLGLSVMSESIGIMNNTIINASYAYHHTLPFGKIGAGLGFGMIQNSIDLSEGIPPDLADVDDRFNQNALGSIAADPSLAGESKDGGFDMNFGVYFKGNTGIRAGISTTHITTSELTGEADQTGSILNYEVANHWFFYGGYDYQLSNPDWVLQPRILVKTEFSTTQVDINCKALYREMIWGGLTYRLQDAAIAMAGFQRAIGDNQNLRIGLAYDITTNQLRQYSSGTVELAVNYCFKIIPKPKFQRHKTVRFL